MLHGKWLYWIYQLCCPRRLGSASPRVARSAWWRLLSEHSRTADPDSVPPARRAPAAGWRQKQQQR